MKPGDPDVSGAESPVPRKLPTDAAYEIGVEAYTYLYPLVLMEVTRRQMTNYGEPTDIPGRGPPNRFAHAREFPDASFKDVVSPNVDTLYSIAWLELSKEPLILSVPATDRYYLLPILDMWTDVFASIGTRTTGNDAATFAIVGPHWAGGALPDHAEIIRAPTRHAWIVGRAQTNGKSDYLKVHQFQDSLKLVPASQWDDGRSVPKPSSVDASIDMTTPPAQQVARLDAATFFRVGCKLLEQNAPHAGDQPVLARLRRVGLVPGDSFDLRKLEPRLVKALEAGADDAKPLIEHKAVSSGQVANNWQMNLENIGAYGSDYLQRAAVALFGLGANLPQDAIYPIALADGDGQPLDGSNRYLLHFDKDELPPARAFWSVTLYTPSHFLFENGLHRHALGDRDPLKLNPDGSLDLYIQPDSPGATKEPNWLPSPSGPFNLIMRLYWPALQALTGAWSPPGIQPEEATTLH